MIKIFRLHCLVGILVLLCPSCEKWDLDQEDFIAVELNSLEPLSINTVQLSGEIKDLRIGQISEHGFIWTTQSTLPTFFDNEGSHYLGIKDVEDPTGFSAELEDLYPDSKYTFRAFATLDGTINYSEAIVWESGTGMVSTDSFAYNTGLSFNVYGSISGMGAGLVAINHGFCWSTENEVPSLSDNFQDLGIEDENLLFSHTLPDLENFTTVYFRAFAVLRHPATSELDTLYGLPLSFNIALTDIWTRKADFGGFARNNAVGFSINDKGYMGVGDTSGVGLTKDFWEYDPQMDSWTQKADFGGGNRVVAVGFSINDKGYIGTGVNFTGTYSDLWEYDPQIDNWTQKTNSGGGTRQLAIGFSVNNKAYLGLGNRSDFWEYDPQTDIWTQKANFGGGIRSLAVGFSINGKGYVGTGVFDNSVFDDFWEYDPQTNNWTQKADFGGVARKSAVGFSINGKGYIGTGYKSDIFPPQSADEMKDFWEYDPQIDSWTQKTNFGGVARLGAIGFSINGRGYIGTGNNIFSEDKKFKDFWEYIPSE